MKDKSIKSTMKSWIMLSEKELDDTQVYMQEQEQQDQQEKDNSFSEAESGSSNVGSAKYESQVSDTGTETFSDAENGFERKLSREEQVDQLIKEAGEEVVDPEDIEMLEDLIMAAANEAYRQLDEFSQSSMAKITGGMGGLGGMPF